MRVEMQIVVSPKAFEHMGGLVRWGAVDGNTEDVDQRV
jgi:hypothetical protein